MKRALLHTALTATLLSVGCAGRLARVDRVLRSYESALRLEVITETRPLVIGDSIPLSLTLSNSTSQRIDGCLGPNQTLSLVIAPTVVREGRPPLARQATLIDHPSCKQVFSLGPAEKLEWQQPYEVPDLGAGEADLHASVQVLYPRECHRLYGCYGIPIEAPPRRLSLVRARKG